jgi:hypothetical protein
MKAGSMMMETGMSQGVTEKSYQSYPAEGGGLVNNHKISYQGGIAEISFTGTPRLSEIIQIIDDLAETDVSDLRLWDFSKTTLDFTTQELREIASHGKSKFILINRIAMVAGSDLVFGLMRMFAVFREQEHTKVHVFRSREKAINWLKTGIFE